MPSGTRRARRVTPATTWAAIAAALVVHAALLGSSRMLGVGLFGGAFSHVADAPETADDVELKPSCLADAVLASSARYALCLAPWRGDGDTCFDDAQTSMVIDLSSCRIRNEQSIAEVAMLEPRTADKLKPIDPEPLLEMLEQQQKPPPPPQLPKPQPQEQKPPPPQPPAPKRPMQVVETAKPSTEQAPENSRFLAEFDTHVEKQTVARGSVQEPMVAKSKPAELTPKPDPKESSVKQKEEDRPRGADRRAPDVPGSLAMRTPGMPSPAEMQQDEKTRGSTGGAVGPSALDGYLARRGEGAIEQRRHDRSEVPKGQGGAGGGAPPVLDLKPTQETLERALGGGNVDHMDDVDNGDETALNAKRWVYASFFNRLKRQVAQNWDPASVWRRSDPTGQVYGFKTRVTEVRVSLSPKGDLAKIIVTSPCGVGELDTEAVRAFQAAAPFPNPPKELVASDGTITFAFSFFFEIGSPHTSWRVIRSM